MKYLTIMTVIFALLSSMPGCSSEPTIHQVTFDSNGGGAVPSVNVTDGAGIEKPHDPAKPGYSFKGWYRQNDYQHEWDFSTDVVTADLTLHAKWEAESYTVTFDAQGGDAPDPTAKEVVFDQAYGELANTTKTGYRLVGWTTKPNGGGSSVDASTICTRTEDHTLYAKWEPTVPFIGEAGGLVFYENPNHETDGWRYLEAAPKGWNGEDTDPMVIFGYYRPQGGVAEKTGANGREIGDGLLNTQILVDKMG
ncbi:MAG: InlB B-repeat-containing protein, partial [Spirochaetales bacterium]|nr:InlB B-repeat-containing protein [Spirochaetales bacterium]